MPKFITFFLIVLLFSLTGFAQTTPSNVQPRSTDPNEVLLRYEEFLRDEARLHREYTQNYYDTIWKLLGALGVAITGVLTWLNWQSKDDIKKQVNEKFKDTVQILLDEKLKQIDNLIKDGKEKSENQFEDIGKIILELSAMSATIGPKGQVQTQQDEAYDVDNLKGKTILWVDDYPENNDSPRSMLEQAGVDFSLALNTEDAVDMLQKQKFDLIISDMGRGDNHSAGLDLLKEIKRLNIKTPAIICASSYGIETYGKEAFKLGAVAVISGVTRVLNVIQKILLAK